MRCVSLERWSRRSHVEMCIRDRPKFSDRGKIVSGQNFEKIANIHMGITKENFIHKMNIVFLRFPNLGQQAVKS